MDYTQGRIGRIFLLKFKDDDIVVKTLEMFASKERLRSGMFVFLGALKKGHLVAGPKKPVVPPEPYWLKFKDAWEVFGVGSIFSNKKGKPQIHVHTSMGKKTKVLTGCLRKDSKVFLVIEAVVFELKGVKALKDIDPSTGLNLLRIFH
jgi:predicted DNA-binding protein with PD1-like motif